MKNTINEIKKMLVEGGMNESALRLDIVEIVHEAIEKTEAADFMSSGTGYLDNSDSSKSVGLVNTYDFALTHSVEETIEYINMNLKNNININGQDYAEDQYSVFSTRTDAENWATYDDAEGVTAEMTDTILSQDDIKSGMTVYVVDEETLKITEVEVN